MVRRVAERPRRQVAAGTHGGFEARAVGAEFGGVEAAAVDFEVVVGEFVLEAAFGCWGW